MCFKYFYLQTWTTDIDSLTKNPPLALDQYLIDYLIMDSYIHLGTTYETIMYSKGAIYLRAINLAYVNGVGYYVKTIFRNSAIKLLRERECSCIFIKSKKTISHKYAKVLSSQLSFPSRKFSIKFHRLKAQNVSNVEHIMNLHTCLTFTIYDSI